MALKIGGIVIVDNSRNGTLVNLTTTGTLTVGGSAGTSGQILQSTGTGLQWATLTSIATASNLAGGAAGQIVYQSGAGATSFSATGTSGQVLTSTGTTAPAWVNITTALGFTPVQQGGVAGQSTNKVYMGWASDASGIKLRVDATDMGYVYTSAGGYRVPFSEIQSKPTTLAGYGITDAYTSSQVDALLLGPSVISVNSTSAALRITQTGSGNALVVEDSTNPDSTPFMVDANGYIYQGRTISAGVGSSVPRAFQQFSSDTVQPAGASFVRGTNDTSAPVIIMGKSRATTAGGAGGAVILNDGIGALRYTGDDGTNLQTNSVEISAFVDGTVSTGVIPSRVSFHTSNSAGTLTEALRIDSSQRVISFGKFGVGGTSFTDTSAISIGSPLTGGTTQHAVNIFTNVASDVTSAARGYRSQIGTAGGVLFTLANLHHFVATQLGIGAATSVTSQIGFIVEGNLTGATNNYGFSGNIAAPVSGVSTSATISSISCAGTVATITTTAAHGYTAGQTVTIAATANATALVAGALVTILTVGTTNYTLIGAANNNIGTSFVATGAGTGSGTVTLNCQGSGKTIASPSGSVFTITAPSATFATITLLSGTVTVARNYNLYMAGTADNYLAGNVGIGTTTNTNGSKMVVNGVIESTTGGIRYPDGTVQTTTDTLATVIGRGNSTATMIKSTNGVSTSLTDGAFWANASGGALLFDDNAHKRISWNDGGGNFNIRSGCYHDGTNLVYAKGAGDPNSGATSIVFNGDGSDGQITLNAAPVGVPGATVTWSNTLFITPTQLINPATTASTSTSTGALVLSGGMGVAGNANIGGNLAVTGNLTINGTTTTINSTTMTVDDPIITLGGDTAPAADDNKDRGVEFRWHNGTTAKLGFFGFDDSTGKFTVIPDATNTSEVFSGTKGTIDANIDWTDVLNKPTIGTTTNNVTFNNGGTGASSGSTFNGSSAITVSYNTIGSPSTAGTNATGTWGISISGTAAALTSNSSITTPVITGTKEIYVTMVANDINVAAGNYFSKTISGITSLTVSNVPSAGTAVSFILDLTNGGSAAITWWTGVKWASATPPNLTPSGRDILGFFTYDGGTTWNGLLLALDVR